MTRRLVLFLIVILTLVNAASAITYIGYSGNTGDYNTDGTNDEVQINAAISAARYTSDHTVYLKGSHTYNIDAPILIFDNIILRGDSTATIRLVNAANWGANVPMIRGYTTTPFSTATDAGSGNGDYFEMYGFKIDANAANQWDTVGGDMWSLGKDFYDILRLYDADNVKIHHMYLTDSGCNFLCVRNGNNWEVYYNTMIDSGHEALYYLYGSGGSFHHNTVKTRTNTACRLTQSNNFKIYDNYIYSEQTGTRTGPGIEIDKTDPSSTRSMANIEIYNNVFENIYGAAIWAASQYSDNVKRATGLRIHHNIIKNCGHYNTVYSNAGIVLYQFDGTQIYNNVFDGCGKAGIEWSKGTSSYNIMSATFTTYVHNNLIMNTVGRKNPSTGAVVDSPGYAIYNYGTDSSRHTIVASYNDLYANSYATGGTVSTSNNLNVNPNVVAGSGASMRYAPMSKYGRYTGSVWAIDGTQSPLIDAGMPYSSTNPMTSYTLEPEDNGNRVNIGRWGNTPYGSKSGGTSVSPPVLTISATLNVNEGSSAYLGWTVSGSVTSVFLEPNNVYLSPASGGTYDWVPDETKTYTVTATGPGGTDVDTFTVNCISDAPYVVLYANPKKVTSGSPSTLIWATSGTVTSLSIDNGVGPVSPFASGQKVVNPTVTTNYTITATGPAGSSSDSVVVEVTVAPVYPAIQEFLVNDSQIYSGSSAMLSWNVINADSVTIDNNIGTVPPYGYYSVTPTSNTTYIMTATNENGTATDSVSITIIPNAPSNPVIINSYDTRIKSSTPNDNYQALDYLDIGGISTTKYRDLLWVNTSAIPETAIIDDAKLKLYWYYNSATRTNPSVIDVYRLIPWVVSSTTWNNKGVSSQWTNQGGDWYDKNGVSQGNSPFGTITLPVGSATEEYISIDITDLVASFVNGTYDNNGLLLKTRNETSDYIAFRSMEDTQHTPYLDINYGPVNITSSSPVNGAFGILNNTSQEFIISLHKKGDVDWYINDTRIRSDDLIEGSSSFTHAFTEVGTYVVKAQTCSESLVWTVEVTEDTPSEPPIPYIPEGFAYVSWRGSDVTGNGSILAPYANITKALKLPYNDSLTILVEGGEYSENVEISQNNILISNYNGTPVFSGSGTAFNVSGNYISIYELIVEGYEKAANVFNGSEIDIYNNTFNNTSIDVGYSENVTILNNEFYNTSYGIEVDSSDGIEISECIFDNISSVFKIGGCSNGTRVVNNSEFYNNTFSNCEYVYNFESGESYNPVYVEFNGTSLDKYMYLFPSSSGNNVSLSRSTIHNETSFEYTVMSDFNATWEWLIHGDVVNTDMGTVTSYAWDNVPMGDGVLLRCTNNGDLYNFWVQRAGEYTPPPVDPPEEPEVVVIGANITLTTPITQSFSIPVGTRQLFTVTLDEEDNVKWLVNGNLLRYARETVFDTFRYRADDLGVFNITAETNKSEYMWNVSVVMP